MCTAYNTFWKGKETNREETSEVKQNREVVCKSRGEAESPGGGSDRERERAQDDQRSSTEKPE